MRIVAISVSVLVAATLSACVTNQPDPLAVKAQHFESAAKYNDECMRGTRFSDLPALREVIVDEDGGDLSRKISVSRTANSEEKREMSVFLEKRTFCGDGVATILRRADGRLASAYLGSLADLTGEIGALIRDEIKIGEFNERLIKIRAASRQRIDEVVAQINSEYASALSSAMMAPSPTFRMPTQTNCYTVGGTTSCTSW